jgi:hypothetical protein
MRFMIPAAAFALLTAPVLAPLAVPQSALAQTSTAPATTTPDAGAPPAAPAAPKKAVGHRMSLPKRFDLANVTHDGHLTKDQATAAKWTYVTKNFAAIDSAKKGYVTVDDIRAFSHAQHVSHKKPVPATPATAPATNS